MNSILFKISISLLVFWVLISVVCGVCGIEFNNENLESAYLTIRFWGVPTCILLLLTGILKQDDSKNDRIAKVIFIMIIAILAFIFMLFTLFFGLCNWTINEKLYTNKANQNIQIINRDYGCGAWDSGSPINKNFYVREVTPYFLFVKEIDINSLDLSKWVKSE